MGNLRIFAALLGIMVLAFSCKEPDEVGQEVQPPSDQLNVLFTDTVSIHAYSVIEDSVVGDELYTNLLGSYMDPIFGQSNASIYTQLRLSSNNIDFGTNPVCDSIVLSFIYRDVYGDTNTQHTLHVYEITEDIYRDSTYYSNRTVSVNNVDFANGYTFVPKPNDSIFILDAYQPAQLRVRLDDALGTQFLNAGSAVLADNDAFLSYFKGLYVTTEAVTSQGSIMYFDLENYLSKLTLFYHNDSQDSLLFDFVINENNARFNHFDHNGYQTYTDPSLLAQLNGDTALGDSLLYLQSMAGVKTFFRFPFLKALENMGDIAVNKAVLVVSVDENESTTSTYLPPVKLSLARVTEEGNNSYLLDQYMSAEYFDGNYNSTKKEYRFNIALHIQQLLNDEIEDYGLRLLVSGSSVNAYRVVLNGPERINAPLKLEITYTKLN